MRDSNRILRRSALMLTASLIACSQHYDRAALDKLTYHNNPQRTGWNSQERDLTPATVSNSAFELLWESPQFDSFDGRPPRLFATPLFVERVAISAGKYRGKNLAAIYAAGSTGYVYAVNAFSASGVEAGEILWRARLTDKPCFKGDMGNLSTPVIDVRAQRLYVTSCDDAAQWRAHALDLGSGREIPGWPVAVNHTTLNIPGINKNGDTRFPETLKNLQRGALNLSPDGSRLYVAFGGDSMGGSGWLVSVDSARAKVASAFAATAITAERQGGMWSSGGPSVDRQGHVHIATGADSKFTQQKAGIAGVFPDSEHAWGQSILQFKDGEQGLQLTGTYTPFNYCQAAAMDIDLGSSGTVAIDLDPTTTATPQLLALGGGKQGNAYLLDRLHLPGSLTKRHPCSEDPSSDASLLSPDIQPHFGARGPINLFGGQSLYEQRCAACHNSGQEGVPPHATLASYSRERIIAALTGGVMQAQATGLTNPDITAIAAYLVTPPPEKK